MDPAPEVFGGENIPTSGPCLVVFNHYSRPGFHAWWIALAVASLLPKGAHFVMTNELTFPGRWYAPFGRPVSRWVLIRAAKVYGFSSMPPMPPRAKDVSARARSVKDVLAYADRTSNPVICLAPEGGDNPGGGLAVPPSGVGRFIGHLAGRGLKISPAGIWEQDGILLIRFGPPFELAVPDELPPDERDRQGANQVMNNIALLLPRQFRGAYQ